MDELKNNQLVFVGDDGDEILCDIIFTYESKEFEKNYVFFVPAGREEDEDGNVGVACASFIPTEGGIGELSQVETDEEWEVLSKVFESYIQENGCGCCNHEDCEDCEECEPDCEDNCEEGCCCSHKE